MASHLSFSQPHSLGKMEAKRRCEATAAELAAQWGFSIYWVDNVCTGTGLGMKIVLTVRAKSADCVMDLPDTYDSQVSVIEDKSRYKLATTLR